MEHILPAVVPKSVAHLTDTLARLSFASALQIDVVDGMFASPVSWPYAPSGFPAEVAYALEAFDVEIDLMAYRAIEAAYEWHRIGVRRFIFHIESLDGPEMLLAFKKETGAVIGCSLSNDTPLSSLEPYIGICDFVQLMGIAHIGAQGEPFDERVLTRIEQLKATHPELSIAIDGSVDSQTLPRMRDAGAERFAVGSAILASPDPEAAYRELISLRT